MRHVGLVRPAAPAHIGGLVWARTPAAAGRDPLLGTESGNEDEDEGATATAAAAGVSSTRAPAAPVGRVTHGDLRRLVDSATLTYGLAGIARRD